MGKSILVVEDDQVISMALRDRLLSEGYKVKTADNGVNGFKWGQSRQWDLIILDLMLPDKNGLELCRDLRAKNIETPILMLTAKAQTVDKVIGLKMGADDYLSKPFEMIELLARVEAITRRKPGPTISGDSFQIKDFTLDFRKQELSLNNKTISLSTYEYKLLKYLCDHRGEIIDRDELLNEVWGYDAVPYTRTVDIHIGQLRKKLNDNKKQEIILTVRNRGYKLI